MPRNTHRSIVTIGALIAGLAFASSAQARSLKCSDVVYRYSDLGQRYKMVATSITAQGVTCGQARHLAYNAARAHVDSYDFYRCPRDWSDCSVPKHLDGFTLRWHHILSDLGRVTATRGAATVRFTIYRT